MKLISLNIEGHRHLEKRTIPFLKEEQPDVACLQEVFAADVGRLEQATSMTGFYVPMADVDRVSIHHSHAFGAWGLLILARGRVVSQGSTYYENGHNGSSSVSELDAQQLPIFFDNDDPNSMHRAVAWVTVEGDSNPGGDQDFTFATTHFTWSLKGSFTDRQAKSVKELMAITEKLPPHILCGDFNSPRIFAGEEASRNELAQDGANAFGILAKKYHDNIPPKVKTSLDGELHKAGPLELMVDGMFSMPEYELQDVRVVSGVSDHMAVVGEVSRN